MRKIKIHTENDFFGSKQQDSLQNTQISSSVPDSPASTSPSSPLPLYEYFQPEELPRAISPPLKSGTPTRFAFCLYTFFHHLALHGKERVIPFHQIWLSPTAGEQHHGFLETTYEAPFTDDDKDTHLTNHLKSVLFSTLEESLSPEVSLHEVITPTLWDQLFQGYLLDEYNNNVLVVVINLGVWPFPTPSLKPFLFDELLYHPSELITEETRILFRQQPRLHYYTMDGIPQQDIPMCLYAYQNEKTVTDWVRFPSEIHPELGPSYYFTRQLLGLGEEDSSTQRYAVFLSRGANSLYLFADLADITNDPLPMKYYEQLFIHSMVYFREKGVEYYSVRNATQFCPY